MKYAIISDVHANLEALTSVLEDAEERGVKRFICLGDVVGYNANPSECVDIIRELGCPVIKGNHDAYTVADEIPAEVNGRAKESLEWTRKNIRPDQAEWLENLPMQRRVGPFEVVHASLHEPEAWNYVLNAIEAILHFHFQETAVCFFGHTHKQMYFTTEQRKTFSDYEKFYLNPEYQYLVNVGSVGQPRGDGRLAEYVIYDTDEQSIEPLKIPYDVETTCRKIRAAGLPEHNALRLEKSALEAAESLKPSSHGMGELVHK